MCLRYIRPLFLSHSLNRRRDLVNFDRLAVVEKLATTTGTCNGCAVQRAAPAPALIIKEEPATGDVGSSGGIETPLSQPPEGQEIERLDRKLVDAVYDLFRWEAQAWKIGVGSRINDLSFSLIVGLRSGTNAGHGMAVISLARLSTYTYHMVCSYLPT